MRILNVFMLFSAFALIVGCSSGTPTTPATGTETGMGTGTGELPPQNSNDYGSGYPQDQYRNQYGTTTAPDDLPPGTVPAIFGHDGRDWTIFLGFILDKNNSYSVCNQTTYGNPVNQYSIFNAQTFGNPYAAYSAANPQAQVPPTIWQYDTATGFANFVGYLRTGGGQGITDPRTLCGY